MHHVVMFSGGAASYVAAKRVIERYGKENVTLLFADTRTEDETLYEFVVQAEKALGLKVTIPVPQARYLYHERREQEFREFIGKDVSILTDQIRIPGEKKYRKETLTLKQFRERIEAQGEGLLQIDFEDSGGGGCGCFSDGQED